MNDHKVTTKTIDWTQHDGTPHNRCVCQKCKTMFYSHSKFDGWRVQIVSRTPCPTCGSDEMYSSATEWHKEEITKSDVGGVDEPGQAK